MSLELVLQTSGDKGSHTEHGALNDHPRLSPLKKAWKQNAPVSVTLTSSESDEVKEQISTGLGVKGSLSYSQ